MVKFCTYTCIFLCVLFTKSFMRAHKNCLKKDCTSLFGLGKILLLFSSIFFTAREVGISHLDLTEYLNVDKSKFSGTLFVLVNGVLLRSSS